MTTFSLTDHANTIRGTDGTGRFATQQLPAPARGLGDTPRPAVVRHENDVLDTPLTPYEIGLRMSESGHIEGLITLDQDELGGDLEDRFDLISQRLIGSTALIDSGFEMKSVTRDGRVVVSVIGALDGVYDSFTYQEYAAYQQGAEVAEQRRDRGWKEKMPEVVNYMEAGALIPQDINSRLQLVPPLPDSVKGSSLHLRNSFENERVYGRLDFEGGRVSYQPALDEDSYPDWKFDFPETVPVSDRDAVMEHVEAATKNYVIIREATARRLSENPDFVASASILATSGPW